MHPDLAGMQFHWHSYLTERVHLSLMLFVVFLITLGIAAPHGDQCMQHARAVLCCGCKCMGLQDCLRTDLCNMSLQHIFMSETVIPVGIPSHLSAHIVMMQHQAMFWFGLCSTACTVGAAVLHYVVLVWSTIRQLPEVIARSHRPVSAVFICGCFPTGAVHQQSAEADDVSHARPLRCGLCAR